MLVTAFIVSIVAIAQIPSGDRVSAPFEGDQGEPNTLGGYLVLIGSVTAGLLLAVRNRTTRTLLVGLLMFMVVPFLLTLSRGSYLALPFSYLALIVLKRHNRFGMIAVFLLLAAIGTAMVPQSVKDRILYTVNQGQQAITECRSEMCDLTAPPLPASTAGRRRLRTGRTARSGVTESRDTRSSTRNTPGCWPKPASSAGSRSPF